MKPNSTTSNHQQETYVRNRDNPFFDGMRRGETPAANKGRIFDFPGKSMRKNIYRSVSDIGNQVPNTINITVAEDATYSPKDSPPDIVLEPIGRSSSGRWSKTSSPLIVPRLDLNINFHNLNEPLSVSSPNAYEESITKSGLERLAVQRLYNVGKGQTDLSNIPLPPSAALFYYGPSPRIEVVESCPNVYKLNKFLKASRDDVNAGVPGRFLHAVIGPDAGDVGSVASTIAHAFYLYENLKGNQFCTVPVINMKRADLDSHADLQWLLDSCHVDASSLIFIDEIDLSYYDLFGSLKLVLLNCDKVPSELEVLREAIIEVFYCSKLDSAFSWVDSITARQDASCCTLIAEKFATISPEILAGQGFSRLLLAGILLDTGNLSSPQCTSKDNYMATLLINGAGRFGCNGLYQILKYKTHGLSDLQVGEILGKEFKKWTMSGKPNTSNSRSLAPNSGMSSIGMSVAWLLSHYPNSIPEILHFQKLENLGLLVIVSGYYDAQKNFKREILVSAESAEHMKNLLLFLNARVDELPLKGRHQPGLKDEMRVFEVDKVTSRRNIEWILDEFCSTS